MNYSLPLLKFISDKYEVSLEDTLVIACQHLLGTTYDLFEELFSKGLKPQNVHLIGKCYSTNTSVIGRFKNKGVRVSSLSSRFDGQISFDEQFQSNLDDFVRSIDANFSKFKKIVILDDGGQLISYANDFFNNFSNIIGIEQTSSGYSKLENIKLNFPVINIARSQAKLEIESPMIAELGVSKIISYFDTNSIKDPKVLVVGQGYIGMHVSRLLKEKYSVNGCDLLENRCDFSGNYKQHLNEFDVIVGATGQTIISPGDFGKLKEGVTLISISSSDREFSASYLRSQLPKIDNCHENIKVNGITLLNGGFPINFDGSEHSLAPEKIQLTRSLLLAGIYQGVIGEVEDSGLRELNAGIQKEIISEFKKFSSL